MPDSGGQILRHPTGLWPHLQSPPSSCGWAWLLASVSLMVCCWTGLVGQLVDGWFVVKADPTVTHSAVLRGGGEHIPGDASLEGTL